MARNSDMPSSVIAFAWLLVGLTAPCSGADLLAHDPTFFTLIDKNAVLQTIAHSDVSFAHEAPVWIPATNELFFVSNRLQASNQSVSDPSQPQHIQMSKLNLGTKAVTAFHSNPDILMANGAIRISEDEIVVCSQGLGAVGGSLIQLNIRTLTSKKLVDTYNYLPFNSPNDVVYSSHYHGYFFTDPNYGFAQGFRNPSVLPPSVYFFNPTTGLVKALITTGIAKPNGLVLSLDSKVLYVTDSGFFTGATTDPGVPRVIYQYEVSINGQDGSPDVKNGKVFAEVAVGIADGIKLDVLGNVWTGEGDGVSVYSPAGKRLGQILLPGGAANLAFVNPRSLVMLAETNIFLINLLVDGSYPPLPPI
ncbi:hypothetical protein BV898_13879 [Hypsibius exemplaris]|uniref:SMP-30/Gluconolactonase/LRE-like region domain-containing protein n=1 Tax=Hypsibius exemplaris TaxID=2072580 RepID=A0A1W0W9H2_HYPEX|nr:hypothetical protein BV898_13879 [Hypsibius exemplaris]